MMSSPRPWSLRRRLTSRVLMLVVAGWFGTMALTAIALHHELNEVLDQELQLLVETTVLFLDTAEDGGIPRTFGVETNDGERVLRIILPGQPVAAIPWAPLSGDGFHDIEGWRVLRVEADGAIIEAAHTTAWRREEMLEAAWALLILVIPLGVLLIWGLGRLVAKTFHPLTRLAKAVGARNPDDLSTIRAEDLPQELSPLVDGLNGYLARIAALRNSERDFVANAAHELRTPLAALRGRLELSNDPDATAALATIDGLTRRVERLLQLSRLEAGVGMGRGPADLVRILHMLIDTARPGARHAIRFDDNDLERLRVAADADALAILLRNIIENALEHGTGEVRITLTPEGQLTIANPTDRTELPTGRFDRSPVSTGMGLGLSIIEALAQAMDVTLTRHHQDGMVRVNLGFRLSQRR